MKLTGAAKNEHYTIKSIDGEEKIRRRLLDMGFTEGCEIRIVRLSPFGKTLLVELRGNRFAMRRETAELINIE